MTAPADPVPAYVEDVDAVAFDLLTALINSWPLWRAVAGDPERGDQWRRVSLRIVTAAGTYFPYADAVSQAAAETGLAPGSADALLARWGELRPWEEVPRVLGALAGRRLAVLTNCSQALAETAAAACGARFELVMSAERAGIYKTDPRAYRAMLEALGLPAQRVLFVAGSAHDVPGASAVGMRVYWANRLRLPAAPTDQLLINAGDTSLLPGLLGAI